MKVVVLDPLLRNPLVTYLLLSNCASCRDATTCEKCDANFELDNNKCKSCPAGMSPSGISCEKPRASKSTKTAKSGKIEVQN